MSGEEEAQKMAVRCVLELKPEHAPLSKNVLVHMLFIHYYYVLFSFIYFQNENRCWLYC
uniref:Uncharacterized protein n=1 Tax=Anguilla anguilla TaxID=7936 RepID=A0A0E9VXA5_ANGAN